MILMTAKFARHQTIHRTLERPIDMIRNLPGVDRVILGPSRGIRHNRPVGSIHIQTNMPTGIKICGFSDRGVSEFYIITSNVDVVRVELLKRFDNDN